jgi:hypothetical protein
LAGAVGVAGAGAVVVGGEVTVGVVAGAETSGSLFSPQPTAPAPPNTAAKAITSSRRDRQLGSIRDATGRKLLLALSFDVRGVADRKRRPLGSILF